MNILTSRRGNTLLTVLMAAALGSIVMFASLKMMQNQTAGFKHAELKNDINAIKQHILTSIDCTQSLQTGNPVGSTTPSAVNRLTGNDCDPTSVNYKLLELKDASGHLLGSPLVTAPGPLQNTSKLGNWNILAQCDRVNHTLIIKAALVNGNTFGTDPMTKRTYDFSNNNSLYLFGGPGLNPIKICQANLGGTPPAGFYAGALFGGTYQVFTHDAAVKAAAFYGTSCRIPNQVTMPPLCTCPTGFTAMMIHEWTSWCNMGFYWDAGWGTPAPPPSACGVESYVCYKSV